MLGAAARNRPANVLMIVLLNSRRLAVFRDNHTVHVGGGPRPSSRSMFIQAFRDSNGGAAAQVPSVLAPLLSNRRVPQPLTDSVNKEPPEAQIVTLFRRPTREAFTDALIVASNGPLRVQPV